MVDIKGDIEAVPVDLLPDIVKEGDKVFQKTEIDLEALIQEQENIILSLQEQMDNANKTIDALKSKR